LGGSEIPSEPWTVADCAADGLALLDHMGWDSYLVAGISFGGMVAQELAIAAPRRVERLALLCTSSGGAGGSSYPLHELDELPVEERITTGLEILDRRFTGDWLATHPSDRAIVSTMTASRAAPLSEERQRGAAGQLEARRLHDVHDRLGAITCPTIVACGRYDGIAPPANSEAIAAKLADADLRVYEGGHLFFLQDRRALPEIFDFLSG
jgi:pimeloyl-ACP methyl ester carboxylesterase